MGGEQPLVGTGEGIEPGKGQGHDVGLGNEVARSRTGLFKRARGVGQGGGGLETYMAALLG